MPHCGASVGVVQGTSKHNRRHTAAKCCAETCDPRLRRDSSMVPTSYAPPDVFYVLPRSSPPKLVQARARPKWDGSEGLDVRSGTQSARSGHCTQCGSGLADPRLGGLGHRHSAGSVMRATCQRGTSGASRLLGRYRHCAFFAFSDFRHIFVTFNAQCDGCCFSICARWHPPCPARLPADSVT